MRRFKKIKMPKKQTQKTAANLVAHAAAALQRATFTQKPYAEEVAFGALGLLAVACGLAFLQIAEAPAALPATTTHSAAWQQFLGAPATVDVAQVAAAQAAVHAAAQPQFQQLFSLLNFLGVAALLVLAVAVWQQLHAENTLIPDFRVRRIRRG